MRQTADIVLGLGFGDEGKGTIVDDLALHSNPNNTIVIRFSGGHQVGHTVNLNGTKRHVFSNFGSGTAREIPTYWSYYCTVEPIGLINELESLNKNEIFPKLIVHPECPLTTVWDIESNRLNENNRNHGTVGIGFGETLKRHENNFKLYVKDIFYPKIFDAKINNIKKFYYKDISVSIDQEHLFFNRVNYLRDIIHINNYDFLKKHKHLIFEGSQGIMLDKDYGFFPSVTRSNTTSKNAIEIINNHLPNVKKINKHYVTRSYLTRHGNGYIPDNKEISLRHNENETNTFNMYQGSFKVTALDYHLLHYALNCDYAQTSFLNKKTNIKNILHVTCMDQYCDNDFSVKIKMLNDIDAIYCRYTDYNEKQK